MHFLDFTSRTTARLILLVMLVAVTISCRQEASSLSGVDASENNKEDMVAVTESLVRYDGTKSVDPVVTDGEKEDHIHCDISIQPEASSLSGKDASENDQGAASSLSEAGPSSNTDAPETIQEDLVVVTKNPVRYGATTRLPTIGQPEPTKDRMRYDITLAPVLPDPILKEIGDTCGDEDVTEQLRLRFIHVRFSRSKRTIHTDMMGSYLTEFYFGNIGYKCDSSFEVESTNVTPDKITIIGTATVDTEVNKSKKNKYVIHTTIEAPGWEQLLSQGDLVAEGEATEELNAQIRWELRARNDTTYQN